MTSLLKIEDNIKEIWKTFKGLKKEMLCLFYQQNNQLLYKTISKNETRNSGEIDIEALLMISKELSGSKVIAIHNHPYGKPQPSFPDFFQKDYLNSLLRTLGIEMIDFAIVSPYGYLSFEKCGLITDKNSECYKVQIEDYEALNLPKLLFANDIKEKQDEIKKTLSSFNELIFNNNEQYASNFFEGEFLLNKRKDFISKNIFFYKCKSNEKLEIESRIFDINHILEPFEIYSLFNGELIPLKKNGLV